MLNKLNLLDIKMQVERLILYKLASLIINVLVLKQTLEDCSFQIVHPVSLACHWVVNAKWENHTKEAS